MGFHITHLIFPLKGDLTEANFVEKDKLDRIRQIYFKFKQDLFQVDFNRVIVNINTIEQN